MQRRNIGLSPLLLMFLICTRQVAWQGYGDMNSTVLTEIWSFVNANIHTYTGNSNYDAFNTALSDHLNSLWDPAWNVFTIKTTATYDTALYGYAFNNHWMWYNDFQIDSVVLSFVIWKDYNCQGWKTVGENGAASGFDTLFVVKTTCTGNSFEKNDVWNAAVNLSDQFDSTFSHEGYSFVVSQDSDSSMYGRVCVVADNYFYMKKDYSSSKPFTSQLDGDWGNLIVFMTRLAINESE